MMEFVSWDDESPNIWKTILKIVISNLVGGALTILKNDGVRQWDG